MARGPLARRTARGSRSGRWARWSARGRSLLETRRSGDDARADRRGRRANVPDEAERRRIEPALLALLGVGEAPAGGAPELFSAWRTFFERLAGTGVVALLFEDLHWADPGTLDFIEHLLEWSRNVPILIITLARPGAARDAARLGRRQAVVPRPRPPAARRGARCGTSSAGSWPTCPSRRCARSSPAPRASRCTPSRPSGCSSPTGGSGRASEGGYEPVGELGELAVPATLHALIAARLDAIDAADRALVQDAAVLGQSFTADALAAVAGSTAADLEPRLAPARAQRPDPRRARPAVAGARPVRVRPGAHPGGRLLDAAACATGGRGTSPPLATSRGWATTSWRARSPPTTWRPTGRPARAARRRRCGRRHGCRSGRRPTRAEQLGIADAGRDLPPPGARRRRGRRRPCRHAGAGRATPRRRASRADLAIELLAEAVRLREAADDPGAGRAGDRAARAMRLSAARRRDEAQQVLEAGVARLGDLGDDPRWVRLLAISGKVLGAERRVRPGARRDRAMPLARAERLGLADVAAECAARHRAGGDVRRAGSGRRAPCSAAASSSPSRSGRRTSPSAPRRRSPTSPPSTTRRRPSPSSARSSRRLGGSAVARSRSTRSATSPRTPGGPATGTGRWASSRRPASTSSTTQARSCWTRGWRCSGCCEARSRTMRSSSSPPGSRRSRTVDVEAGKFDLRGLQAFSRGEFGTAADEWIKGVSMSDYNVPYILPRVAMASILARRPDGAAEAIRALVARGTRGRSIDADRATIEAGIAALAGDREAALAGYRRASPRTATSSLQVDEAFLALQAATTLGRATTPRSPAGSRAARHDPRPAPRRRRCSSCSSGPSRTAAPRARRAGPATRRRRGVADRLTGRVRGGRGARGSRPGPASRSPAGPRRRGR